MRSLSDWLRLRLFIKIDESPYLVMFQDGEFTVTGALDEMEEDYVVDELEQVLKGLKVHRATGTPGMLESIEDVVETWRSHFGFSADVMEIVRARILEEFIWIEWKRMISGNGFGLGPIGIVKDEYFLSSFHPFQFVVMCDETFIPLFVHRCAASAVVQLVLNPASVLYQGMSAAKVKEQVVDTLRHLQLFIDAFHSRVSKDFKQGKLGDPEGPFHQYMKIIANLPTNPEKIYTELYTFSEFASIYARNLLSRLQFSKESSLLALDALRRTIPDDLRVRSMSIASKVLRVRWSVASEAGMGERCLMLGIIGDEATPFRQLQKVLITRRTQSLLYKDQLFKD